ncbi:MAG: hypothetical protein ACLFTW_15550, partial [Chitinispirillaceae bacterium]
FQGDMHRDRVFLKRLITLNVNVPISPGTGVAISTAAAACPTVPEPGRTKMIVSVSQTEGVIESERVI